jgi:tRNA (guanine37-N1)-methyltransferase
LEVDILGKSMKINVLTIFPGLFESFLNETLIKRAIENGKLEVNLVDIREYALNKHHTTDDTPYGGGPGMVMKVEPIFRALEALEISVPSPSACHSVAPQERRVDVGDLSRDTHDTTMSSRTVMRDPQSILSETTDSCSSRNDTGNKKTVVLSPRGRQLSQNVVEEYSKLNELTLICGRYEGVDQRVVDNLADEELSIGPYVMSGGEVPAMVVVEAVSRYLPGVLGNPESLKEETNSLRGPARNASLREDVAKRAGEYPQYTRPPEFNDWKVPEVLLSGDHEEIRKWRESKVK